MSCLHIQSTRWREQSSKCWLLATRLHGVISQKSTIWLFSNVIHLIWWIFSHGLTCYPCLTAVYCIRNFLSWNWFETLVYDSWSLIRLIILMFSCFILSQGIPAKHLTYVWLQSSTWSLEFHVQRCKIYYCYVQAESVSVCMKIGGSEQKILIISCHTDY